MASRNRSRHYFSARPFRRPLTTSSAIILIPSSKFHQKTLLKHRTTYLVQINEKNRCQVLLEFESSSGRVFPPLCKGGEWSAIRRAHDGALILADIKLTRLFANANRPEGIYVLPHHPNHPNPLPLAVQNQLSQYFQTPVDPLVDRLPVAGFAHASQQQVYLLHVNLEI